MNVEFYIQINVVVNAGYTGKEKSLRIITANETFNSECPNESCESRLVGELIYLRDVTRPSTFSSLASLCLHTLSDLG